MPAPKKTKNVLAGQIQLGDIVLSDMGYWNRIVSVDRDAANGVISFIGEEIETGARAALWGNVNDVRTIAD
jgi:hypothetical protein